MFTPLLLAAGQRVRVAIDQILAQRDEVEELPNALQPLFRRHVRVELQWLGDRVADADPGTQGLEWLLEDDLHIAPPAAKRFLLRVGDAATKHADVALIGLDQPEDAARHGRLARAALAHKPERLARVDRERDAVDSDHVGYAPATALEPLDERVDDDGWPVLQRGLEA